MPFQCLIKALVSIIIPPLQKDAKGKVIHMLIDKRYTQRYTKTMKKKLVPVLYRITEENKKSVKKKAEIVQDSESSVIRNLISTNLK